MKVKILSQKYNPLLKRKEVVFEVDHREEGQTSSRLELRKNLASMLETSMDLVFVEKVKTKTGTMTALGEANAYESPEQAKLIEREHIIIRNVPKEKTEGKGEAKKEEKPAEAEKKEEEEKAAKPAPKPKEAKKEEEKKEG